MLHFDPGEILQEFVFNCMCRAMSDSSSDSSQEDSLHEDKEEHEEEEEQLEEEEELEDEEQLEEEEELEEQEHLDEESVTELSIELSIEQLVETTDVVMQRELSIVAVPPKVVLQEENQLEVSSSPAFHILDAVSIHAAS